MFTMPPDRRRQREARSSSHWESSYGNNSSSYGGYNSRHYTPYRSNVPQIGRSFNYWRDDSTISSYPPRSHQSYRPDSYDERWRNDSRSWHGEGSNSRRWRDSGPSRERDSWRGRSPIRSQQTSRQSYSTYTPVPYPVPPTFCTRSPPRESIAPSEHQRTPHHPHRKTSPPLSRVSSAPSASPPRSKPSKAYLTLTQSPSEVLKDPTSVRKLLVLDLNGTLLIRSARARVSSGPKLRAVQPRPYMRSFRQYLFSPKTKEWLDTMVWSSAQPHSVDDMVDKVFGPSKIELRAVWNRKSLGLSEEDYHRKSIATKDLMKPWKLLPLELNPDEHNGGSLPSSQSQIVHSASTTLLLDDSPHKAALQPYNHVCIPEYDSTRRNRDLQTLQATKPPKEGKRKKKDQGKLADGEEGGIPDDTPSEWIAAGEPFDATLLAVIGILEDVKLQSNVANWIRKGGLWGGVEQPIAKGSADQGVVVQTGNDESSTSDPGVTPEEAHLQTAMWFSGSTTMAHWVVRGRQTLKELGIEVSHGVTG